MKHFQLILFLLCSVFAFSQEVLTIQGVVKDAKGEPLPGAYVIVKGSQSGVSTDLNGVYLIKIPKGNTLVFKMLGMVSQERAVNKSGTIDIVLQEDLQEIEQVVVTGYQKVDANKVATAYTKIDVQDFQRKAATNVVQGLEGLSSSLVLATNPSDPTGSKEFSIRGISTLSSNSQPLIVVDGFPYQGSIEALNPYQVESITLLKDAASASIYGAKSSNGVIVITTKRGKEGKTQVHYSSQYSFGQKPDLGYALNRVSSSELVDIQYNFVKDLEANDPDRIQSYRYLMENPAYATANRLRPSNYIRNTNRIYYLNALRRFGYLTDADFDSTLNDLRGFDNTKQIEDLYYQSPATNQQNISIMGGNDAFKYNASVNYTQDWGNIKANKDQRVLADFVSNFRISPKASFDFQAHWSSANNDFRYVDRNMGSGSTNVIGSVLSRLNSYDRLYDENGKALSVLRPTNLGTDTNGIFGGKDPFEIERLMSLGLLDETYIPVEDFGKNYQESKSWNTRIQGLFNLDLANYLTLRFGGQYAKRTGVVQDISLRDSWYMRNLINNATPLDFNGDTSKLNIPLGSRITQSRNETTDYLFRAQIDFNKSFDDHSISALAGTEISSNKTEGTHTDRFGYDVKSGLFNAMNYKILQDDMTNVFYPSRNNTLVGGVAYSEGFSEIENRYFSAYGNLTYGYAQKYFLTGSIRLDQSNLFGTDPKYRYRPFWSLAAKWRLGEEDFFKNKTLSKADFRLSYGINGNIANESGPFDIASQGFIPRAGQALGLFITSYKVPNLRWEQTQTINVGADLGFFENKVEVSLDYYHKNSTDILSDVESDPTLGGGFIRRNDASILNEGYEISLTSHNIQKENWLWDTQLNFRYNKGKITKVNFNSDEYAPTRFVGSIANFKGQEPNSLYILNYAGLNSQGEGQIRKADGTLLAVTADDAEGINDLIAYDDLVSAGAVMPKYVASINNNLRYKGFGLSFLFLYQGGHIFMKDSYDGDFIGSGIVLINKDASKAWKTAGDEAKTDIPAISSALYSNLIQGSTKNIRSADFIRLRDVTLSYTLNREFTESIGIRELTFNLKGTNLWLWTKNKEGIDPETQGLGYRTSYLKPTYSVGLNLIF